MSTGLPAALRDGIARFADCFAGKDLAARSAAMSESYRAGRASDAAIADERDVAAYLTTRLPATYAAIAAALSAVRERAPGFAPTRVLDVGAGPGTASWAAVETWPSIETVTMLDRNPHLLAAARALAGASPHPALGHAQFISADLASAAPATASYDLILAGYTFAEIPVHRRGQIITSLWHPCTGVLMIVEPGTPAGFAAILASRTALLAAGARIAAPCPSGNRCPIVAPDWCHFAERLPRTRAHMRAKGAYVPFEDEKYSYVAAARETVDLAPVTARIIAPPEHGKPGVRLRLCTDAQIVERTLAKRDKPAYKSVSRKRWGDAL